MVAWKRWLGPGYPKRLHERRRWKSISTSRSTNTSTIIGRRQRHTNKLFSGRLLLRRPTWITLKAKDNSGLLHTNGACASPSKIQHKYLKRYQKSLKNSLKYEASVLISILHTCEDRGRIASRTLEMNITQAESGVQPHSTEPTQRIRIIFSQMLGSG